jgi:hypothetical protein
MRLIGSVKRASERKLSIFGSDAIAWLNNEIAR